MPAPVSDKKMIAIPLLKRRYNACCVGGYEYRKGEEHDSSEKKK